MAGGAARRRRAMRQAAIHRHKRRQLRCLPEQPEHRVRTKMPADPSHDQSQLSGPATAAAIFGREPVYTPSPGPGVVILCPDFHSLGLT